MQKSKNKIIYNKKKKKENSKIEKQTYSDTENYRLVYDVKHMGLIKTITSVLKIWTYTSKLTVSAG